MKVIFCLPGSSFSSRFLSCWTNLLLYCWSNGIQPLLSQGTSPNIYYVRQMCLGADVTRGKDQKPFDGKIDYDYICWIDSDSIFTPQSLQKLLNYDLDIVAGLQAFEGGQGFTCGKLNKKYFKKHGMMEYYTPDKLKSAKLNERGLLEVDYAGFGLILIKKGVYEKLEYPWHRPEWFKINDCKDFSMEDVGFCINAKKADFRIYVDPSVRIGHEKKAIY